LCGILLAMNRKLSPEAPKFRGSLLRGLLYVSVVALGGAVLFLIVSVAIASVI
jgi:hypothetical protein